MVVTETLILEANMHSTGVPICTTNLQIVPRLRMHGAVPQLSNINFQ